MRQYEKAFSPIYTNRNELTKLMPLTSAEFTAATTYHKYNTYTLSSSNTMPIYLLEILTGYS